MPGQYCQPDNINHDIPVSNLKRTFGKPNGSDPTCLMLNPGFYTARGPAPRHPGSVLTRTVYLLSSLSAWWRGGCYFRSPGRQPCQGTFRFQFLFVMEVRNHQKHLPLAYFRLWSRYLPARAPFSDYSVTRCYTIVKRKKQKNTFLVKKKLAFLQKNAYY